MNPRYKINPATKRVPSREYLTDKIRRFIMRPEWCSDGLLHSLYTILVAGPLSGGQVDYLLAELAQQVDEDLKQFVEKNEKDKKEDTSDNQTT